VARLEEAEAPCFMKNASASSSSKSQMLPSSLPLPASFFKVIPLPQKFNRFRFQFRFHLNIPDKNTYYKFRSKKSYKDLNQNNNI